MRRWRWLFVAGSVTGMLAGFLGFIGGKTPSGGVILPAESDDGARPSLHTGDELTIVSWNIHYGGGPTLEVGRGQSRSEVVGFLDSIASHIREWDADIVALQEVDRGAIRSYDIDQLAWLAAATGMPYAAWTPTWDAKWVPHPGLNPAKHIGRVHSGQAILSRFPFAGAEHIRLPQPQQAGALYNLFYLHRHLTDAEVDLGASHRLRVVNAHLEAFEPINRMDHADRAVQHIGTATPYTVLLGDMNCTPTEAVVRKHFPDEPETDMGSDDTIDRLRNIEGLTEVVPTRAYAADEDSWFTFPAHEPNRRLDYIFHGSGLTLVRAQVPQMSKPPSDHLPVVARFRLD
jgi:endonuclease/exonuclease/phosphatase family metal-dependent hydrolase